MSLRFTKVRTDKTVRKARTARKVAKIHTHTHNHTQTDMWKHKHTKHECAYTPANTRT